MTVAALPKSDLLTGLREPGSLAGLSVSQNYPNPFAETSTITVNLASGSTLALEVFNLAGQRIMFKDRGYVPAGTYYFHVSSAEFPAGIFFYTVKAGDSKVTRKMIVN